MTFDELLNLVFLDKAIGIRLDSRLVSSGDIFVAVKGTLCDGRDFIAQAVSRGAKYVVCQKDRSSIEHRLSAEASAKAEVEINWHFLIERVGSEELVDEIIPIFIKDNSERMQVLSQAVEKNDIGEIKFYAHSLRGASATIGAVAISELSRQLEAAARESDSSGCKPLFEELNVRFTRLVDFLSKSNWKQIAQQASSRQHTERS